MIANSSSSSSRSRPSSWSAQFQLPLEPGTLAEVLPPEFTWQRQPLQLQYGSLLELRDLLPWFEREPFGEGDGENEYLHQVVRQPIGEDRRTIPVGVVSTRYALIQHQEVVDWIIEAARKAGYKPEHLAAELSLSVYGERFRLRCPLPESEFDPGDGFEVGLVVECQNSVERSCALEVRVFWRRLVCLNGLWLDEDETLRKVHNLDWMSRRSVAGFVQHRLERAPREKQQLAHWLGVPVKQSQIDAWADKVVKDAWGVQAAARLCHICRRGFDGQVSQNQKGLPSERLVSSDRRVPGACAPVTNLYHVHQALSWIAGTRKAVEEQQEMLRAAPRLIHYLLKDYMR